MKGNPIRCGVAFRITEEMNADNFEMHFNAAIRAIKRHFGRKAFYGHDEYREMEIPLEHIKIKADGNKIKLACMHICEEGSKKCFIVDKDGNEHECLHGKAVKEDEE